MVPEDNRAAFGDFQTPLALARDVCALLRTAGQDPVSIIEPTCGQGHFVAAALDAFPHVRDLLCGDINEVYLREVERSVLPGRRLVRSRVLHGRFFELDWRQLLSTMEAPILIVGNPPWVTNAGLGVVGSDNRPDRSNAQGLAGIDAITGKSNFDISEWMLRRMLDWLNDRPATIAILCKTAVARKALIYAWTAGVPVTRASLHRIDAKASFGAAVDACLLVIEAAIGARSTVAGVFPDLRADAPESLMGFRDGRLIADERLWLRSRHLEAAREGDGPRWRSGIKHDCSKVMELSREGGCLANGLGEAVDIEDDYVFPLLKGSALAAAPERRSERWMIVPQRTTGDDTTLLASRAPKLWRYLVAHAEHLDRRASSIYRRRAPFCVFGVGQYSFASWKVAVAALYKRLDFKVIGPSDGRPVVFDDTSYFLACADREEAEFVARLMNSDAAREFFEASIFWDAKRPITVDLLHSLDLVKLAGEVCPGRPVPAVVSGAGGEALPSEPQGSLFA